MKFLLAVLLLVTLSQAKDKEMTLYDYTVNTINGKEVKLSKYKGKVILIVNVASECGLTYQYGGLEKLYQKYKKRGFMVLGFPSNQFSKQEPGTDAEIKFFCTSKYDVHFDMFSKIKVNGDDANPLYKYLKDEKGGFLGFDSIKWNFTKFLIDSNGKVIKRFASSTNPVTLEKDIEKLLK